MKFSTRYKKKAFELVFTWDFGNDLKIIWNGLHTLGSLVLGISFRILLILTLPFSAALCAYAEETGERQQARAEAFSVRCREQLHRPLTSEEIEANRRAKEQESLTQKIIASIAFVAFLVLVLWVFPMAPQIWKYFN